MILLEMVCQLLNVVSSPVSLTEETFVEADSVVGSLFGLLFPSKHSPWSLYYPLH